MQNVRTEELQMCLTWFVNQCFGNYPNQTNTRHSTNVLQWSVRFEKDTPNHIDVRIRDNSPEVLKAMDEAAKFYASEIDPSINLNFC